MGLLCTELCVSKRKDTSSGCDGERLTKITSVVFMLRRWLVIRFDNIAIPRYDSAPFFAHAILFPLRPGGEIFSISRR